MQNENRHPVHLSTTLGVFEDFKGYTEYTRKEKIPGEVIEINADVFIRWMKNCWKRLTVL